MSFEEVRGWVPWKEREGFLGFDESGLGVGLGLGPGVRGSGPSEEVGPLDEVAVGVESGSVVCSELV